MKRLYSRAERARREAQVVRDLEDLSRSNPARFTEMMKLLAKLVADTEREERAAGGAA